MFPKSIRWRLQLWVAFLLACILSGFGITAYQLDRTNRLNQIDKELARRVSAVSTEVRARFSFGGPWPRPPGPEGEREGFGRSPRMRPPDSGFGDPRRWPGPDSSLSPRPPNGRFGAPEVRLSTQTLNLFEPAETNSFYYAVWSREGVLLAHSANVPPDLQCPWRLDPSDFAPQVQQSGQRRERFQFTEMGECALVGRSIAADLGAMRHYAWWLAAVGVAVLALGLGGGWVLAGRAIRPVETISAAASRISAGHLSERINVADTDSELGHLAGVLNSTFARLESAFAQQQQFTADASHELRTPLAVIISEAQTTLARPRAAEEYRETVEACLLTAKQMNGLTKSLLELARFDAGQVPMQCAPFELAERAQAAVQAIQPLADERGLHLHCDLKPAVALGDADRLSQVITNLLANAIQYNKPHGDIRVTTRSENQMAVLTIADTGIGISAEDQAHIFDRFYRADKSRARANGRYGLGLAICKAIVDAHRGTLGVASQPGVGTTFTVKLPQQPA
jgi:two-component system, OmpR family, sensor kinase